MRHRKNFNHLSRKSAHRKSMLANMAASLIIHKRINTTLAKAKALRSYVEPLITKAKDDTTHSRRVVFSYLQSKEAVTELFRDISVKIAGRPGGYTRILKTGNRLGDNAEMCMIELVDYNEVMLAEREVKKAKTRRRRGGAKKKSDEVSSTAPITDKEDSTEHTAEKKSPEPETKTETAAEVVEKKEEEKVEAKKEVKDEVTEKPAEPKAEKPQPDQENKKDEEGKEKAKEK